MNLEKIHELNELSSDIEHNLPRMKELAHEIVEALNIQKPDKVEGYEYAHLKVCDKGIQRESCRGCIGEYDCRLDKSYLDINKE